MTYNITLNIFRRYVYSLFRNSKMDVNRRQSIGDYALQTVDDCAIVSAHFIDTWASYS